MNGFKRICAALLGGVFFISGVLKLMDPTGTSLIVGEYFKFFFRAFPPAVLCMSVGIVLSLIETLTGAALITGIRRKATAAVSAFLLIFFTVITLILLIANPSMDCGCFGEAFHLTHLQSFLKNLVLIALWCIAFIPLKDLGEPRKVKYVSFGIAAVSVLLFMLYSLLGIPLVDFTSMKPGTRLLGASDPVVDDTVAYIYEKDGREGAFTTDCPPDSSWTFVREQRYDQGLVDEEENPEVPLSFSDAAGEYADSLATDGQVLLVSSFSPAKLSDKQIARINDLFGTARAKGFTPLLLAASDPDSISEELRDQALLPVTFFADRKDLLTLNRANGGLTFISDGQIIQKWSARAYPDSETLDGLLQKEAAETMLRAESRGKIRLQGFLLYTFAVMLLL